MILFGNKKRNGRAAFGKGRTIFLNTRDKEIS